MKITHKNGVYVLVDKETGREFVAASREAVLFQYRIAQQTTMKSGGV